MISINLADPVDSAPLRFVSSHRDLGMLVDVKLKFHGHVLSVVRKADGMVGELLQAIVCHSSFTLSSFVSHGRSIKVQFLCLECALCDEQKITRICSKEVDKRECRCRSSQLSGKTKDIEVVS